MHYEEQQQNHDETTKYSKWENGMTLSLFDILCDHELALIENSLRESRFNDEYTNFEDDDDRIQTVGVFLGSGGYWYHDSTDKPLTRKQALYIATGRTCF